MTKEEKTTRLIMKHTKGGVSYSCKRQQTNITDYIKVIGYAEVTKSYPFDKKRTEKEMYDYIEGHPAVHYVHWFDERLQGDYE
jgi:hypothetical protein